MRGVFQPIAIVANRLFNANRRVGWGGMARRGEVPRLMMRALGGYARADVDWGNSNYSNPNSKDLAYHFQ